MRYNFLFNARHLVIIVIRSIRTKKVLLTDSHLISSKQRRPFWAIHKVTRARFVTFRISSPHLKSVASILKFSRLVDCGGHGDYVSPPSTKRLLSSAALLVASREDHIWRLMSFGSVDTLWFAAKRKHCGCFRNPYGCRVWIRVPAGILNVGHTSCRIDVIWKWVIRKCCIGIYR